jgi:prolyl-tRNA synthetase
MPGIHEVGEHMGVKPKNMLKTLVCQSEREGEWILGVLRGDHELNLSKLKAAACVEQLDLADDAAAREAGFAIGFVSPRVVNTIENVRLIVDPDAAQEQFWATGDDRIDYHVKHFNWRRDVGDALGTDKIKVADIRNAMEGDPSPFGDGGVLRESRGIEVGHVFKLGTKYSDAMEFHVSGEKQEQISVIMGCYGIGVARILAAAIETHADDNGIVWPESIAPYDVLITPIKFEGEAKDVALRLAEELADAGLDVLIDDRAERPGVKFKDADLIGIPIRLTIGDKALAESAVEFKRRTDTGKGELVKIEEVVGRCVNLEPAIA